MKKNKKRLNLFHKIFYFSVFPILSLTIFFLVFQVLVYFKLVNFINTNKLDKILKLFFINSIICFFALFIVTVIQYFSIKNFSKLMQNRFKTYSENIKKAIENSSLDSLPTSSIKEINNFFENIKSIIKENIILKNRSFKRYKEIEQLLKAINAYIWIGNWQENSINNGKLKYEMHTSGIEKITGLSSEEFINSDEDLWYKIVYKEDLDIIKENENLLKKGKSVISRYRIVDTKNTIKWVLEITYPEIDKKTNKLKTTYGIILDITNQIQLIENLKLSELKFKNFIENSQDGILIVNKEGKVINWNKKVSEIMEMPEKEVIGRYIWDIQFNLLPPEQRNNQTYKRIKHSLNYLYKNHYANWLNKNLEQKIYTSSGKKKYILSTTFIIDYSNFMTGSIIKDITTLKQFQEEAYKKQKIESIGLLAGGIAHDFNNFLTIIHGNLSLARHLLKPQLPENNIKEISKILEEVIWAANKAKNLSTQLLTFTKKGSLLKKTINLYQLIKDSISFSLTGTNINYKIYSFSKNIPFYCDENQFFQIFNNLTINSIQAIKEKNIINGIIQINIKKISRVNLAQISEKLLISNNNFTDYKNNTIFLYISFLDNGTGIPGNVIDKIFDPFFTTKRKGNGIGLTMVYSIVKKHGGKICINSTPSKFTKIELIFPYNSTNNNSMLSKNKTEEINVKNTKRYTFIKRRKRKYLVNKDYRKSLSGEKSVNISNINNINNTFKINNPEETDFIVILEDNENIQNLIKNFCKNLKINCIITSSGIDTFNIIKKLLRNNKIPKVILLDLTIIGGLGGLETNKKLKKLNKNLFTILMSGYSNNIILSEFKKYNFKDILVKPFGYNEFKAKIDKYY